MRQEQADQIVAEWLERTGSGPIALHHFLTGALPDLEAYALSPARPLAAVDRKKPPTILGLASDHLYSIEATDVGGVRAFEFERWRLDQIEVALVEWLDGGMGSESRSRKWTLRLSTGELVIETDEPVHGVPGPLERLMRLTLERAS